MVGTSERSAIDQAYQETMKTLLKIAICGCVPVVLSGLLMKDYRLDTMEEHVVRRDADEKLENIHGNGRGNWKVRQWFNVTAQIELWAIKAALGS